MNVRKILAAIGAALIMIGISAPASAFECTNDDGAIDPAVIQANLTGIANTLRCADYSPELLGEWPKDNPIWERRRVPSCDVHQKLARNLYEKREFLPGTKPRRNKNNDAAGAAWDVRNGQYEEAIMKLDMLIDAVMKATLNRGFEPNVGAAQMLANELIKEAEEARICINQLLP
jgi:hypothetical protein